MIHNGFSFGRKETGIDLFINETEQTDTLAETLAQYENEKIYCSCTHISHFQMIHPLLDSRWILGGPIITSLLKAGMNIPCTATSQSFEEFSGQTELDSQFSYYFEDFVLQQKISHIEYNCSLGKGCYWDKCTFCTFRYYNEFQSCRRKCQVRLDVPGILRQLRPLRGMTSMVHLCMDAIPPRVFKDILQAEFPPNIFLRYFLRADQATYSILQRYKHQNCQQHYIMIGGESLSQTLNKKLHKGTQLDIFFEFIEMLLDCGCTVCIDMMEHYAGITPKMVDETKEAAQKLQAIVQRFPAERLYLYNNGIPLWPTLERAREHSDKFPIRRDDQRLTPRYIHEIPVDSFEFELNRQIADAYKTSGIRIEGKAFIPHTGNIQAQIANINPFTND